MHCAFAAPESTEAERLAALVPAYEEALRMSAALLDSAFVRVDLLAANGAAHVDDEDDDAILGAAQHIVAEPKVRLLFSTNATASIFDLLFDTCCAIRYSS